MKCLRCNTETFRNVKGKPICRDCKDAYKKERDDVRRLGLLALPAIIARTMNLRIKRIMTGFFRRDKDLRP